MSTKMRERDWEIALEVFRVCLPARGAKARDDRLFLEALHFFAVHNICWGAAGAVRQVEQRLAEVRPA